MASRQPFPHHDDGCSSSDPQSSILDVQQPQHTARPVSRFQEGSMNDRVSNVPPLDFLGPAEDATSAAATAAAFQSQFGLDNNGVPVPPALHKPASGASSFMSVPAWASTASLTRPRPVSSVASTAGGSNTSVSGSNTSKSAKRGSAWSLAPLWDKLGFSGSKAKSDVKAASSMADLKVEGPQQRQKLRSKHMSLPMEQVSRPQPIQAAAMQSVPALAPAGNGVVRPSKEEVMESYKTLVASGFFEQHAIHSKRRPGTHRPASTAAPETESTTEGVQHKSAQSPAKPYVPPPISALNRTRGEVAALNKAKRDLRGQTSVESPSRTPRCLKRRSSSIAGGDSDAEATTDTEASSPRKLIKKSRRSAPRPPMEAAQAPPAISANSAPKTSLKQRTSVSSLAESLSAALPTSPMRKNTASQPPKASPQSPMQANRLPATRNEPQTTNAANSSKKLTKKSKKLLTRRRSRSRKRSSNGSSRSRRTSSPSAPLPFPRPLARPTTPRKVAEEFARPPTRGKSNESLSRTTSMADLRTSLAAEAQNEKEEQPLPEPPMLPASLKELRVTLSAADAARAVRSTAKRRPVPSTEQQATSQTFDIHDELVATANTTAVPDAVPQADVPASNVDRAPAPAPSFHYPQRKRPSGRRRSSDRTYSTAALVSIAVPNRAGVPAMPDLPSHLKRSKGSAGSMVRRKPIDMVDASGELQRFGLRGSQNRGFGVREEDAENAAAGAFFGGSANWSIVE